MDLQKDAEQNIRSFQGVVSNDGGATLPKCHAKEENGSKKMTAQTHVQVDMDMDVASSRLSCLIPSEPQASPQAMVQGTKSSKIVQHRRHHSDRCILPRSPAKRVLHRRAVSTPSIPPSRCAVDPPEDSTSRKEKENPSNIRSLYNELDYLKSCTEGADGRRTTRSNKLHGKIAHVCNTIGNHHFRCFQFHQALDAYTQAFNSLIQAVGENHPSVASTLTSMGTVGWKLGQYDHAVQCMNRSADISRCTMGENHPDTARALHNLGQAYCVRGDFERAMDVAEEALRIRREKLGKCDVEVARTISLLGTLFMHQGDLKKAALRHREALNLKRSLMGSQHPSVVLSLIDLGKVYHKRCNHDDALRTYKEALFLQRSAHHGSNKSKEHMVDVGLTHHMIGNIYKDMGRIGKCLDSYRKAGIMYRSAGLAQDHKCMTNLDSSIQAAQHKC